MQFTISTLLSVGFGSIEYFHIALQQISRNVSSCKTETLYLLNNSRFIDFPRSKGVAVRVGKIKVWKFFASSEYTTNFILMFDLCII